MNKRSQTGFSLMAAIAAVAIIAMIMGTTMTLMAKKRSEEVHSSYVDQQAREMALLASAVESYIDANEGEFLHGIPREVTVPQLQAANLLPAEFASRGPGQGTTPFYQGYRLVSIADDGDDDNEAAVRTVIYETGGIADARMARVGSKKTTEGIKGLKEWVAQDLVRKKNVPSGVVDAGTTTARGSMQMFNIDIAPWLAQVPPPANEAIVAALVGFPELEPEPPEIEITMPEQLWGECHTVEPQEVRIGTRTEWRARACPAATTQVGAVPFCGNGGVYPTDVGSLVPETVTEHGRERAIIMGYNKDSGDVIEGPASGIRWSTLTSVSQDTATMGLTWLNGKIVHETLCHQVTYGQGRWFEPPGRSYDCYAGMPRTPLEIHLEGTEDEKKSLPNGDPGCTASSSISRNPAGTWSEPGLGPNDAVVRLCCLPAT